jgi:hypothetical protein
LYELVGLISSIRKGNARAKGAPQSVRLLHQIVRFFASPELPSHEREIGEPAEANSDDESTEAFG